MHIVQVTDQRQVEYSIHNPKIKGLNPTAGTGLEKTAKKLLGGGGEKSFMKLRLHSRLFWVTINVN